MICMICYCLLFVIIGHSRRKNVFLYGCSPALSWLTDDVDNQIGRAHVLTPVTRPDLVCRLLLEKKNTIKYSLPPHTNNIA